MPRDEFVRAAAEAIATIEADVGSGEFFRGRYAVEPFRGLLPCKRGGLGAVLAEVVAQLGGGSIVSGVGGASCARWSFHTTTGGSPPRGVVVTLGEPGGDHCALLRAMCIKHVTGAERMTMVVETECDGDATYDWGVGDARFDERGERWDHHHHSGAAPRYLLYDDDGKVIDQGEYAVIGVEVEVDAYR